MEQLLQLVHFGVALLLLHFTVARTQIQGLTCHSCSDVSSPKHCQQTIECGQEEICFTREYTDHNGLLGFHLGCEEQRTCELLQEANILFGKRDVTGVGPAPPDRCFQCCSKDECNNALCQVGQGTTTTTLTPLPKQGVTCMNCVGVASPEYCTQKTVCGEDEICFTREYMDHTGRRGFRLGCESKARCTLFLNAQALFGKRHLTDPATSPECYDCCSSHECNARLCGEGSQGYSHGIMTHSPPIRVTTSATMTTQTPSITVTTLSVSTTTTKLTPSTTTAAECPVNFLAFENNCFLFDIQMKSYAEAKSYCQNLGAHLVSIHSYEENNFIQNELISLHKTGLSSFWTGGFYSHRAGRFEWTDGSPFNYTNWNPGRPLSFHRPGVDYHVLVTNPAAHGYSFTRMFEFEHTGYTGTICKITS